eukprot:2629141-Rhodomonas_salina.1
MWLCIHRVSLSAPDLEDDGDAHLEGGEALDGAERAEDAEGAEREEVDGGRGGKEVEQPDGHNHKVQHVPRALQVRALPKQHSERAHVRHCLQRCAGTADQRASQNAQAKACGVALRRGCDHDCALSGCARSRLHFINHPKEEQAKRGGGTGMGRSGASLTKQDSEAARGDLEAVTRERGRLELDGVEGVEEREEYGGSEDAEQDEARPVRALEEEDAEPAQLVPCLLYTSPSPRDRG